MPVAIDTSVLIEAERLGTVAAMLSPQRNRPFLRASPCGRRIPGWSHPPTRDDLRYRAQLIYQGEFQSMVSAFTELDAKELGRLLAELKRKGQQMKFFDAAIAASVMARGDKLMTADADFDRLGNKITLIKL